MKEAIKLIQGRINQYELDKKNNPDHMAKLFLQGQIQGLKQALEIIEGKL